MMSALIVGLSAVITPVPIDADNGGACIMQKAALRLRLLLLGLRLLLLLALLQLQPLLQLQLLLVLPGPIQAQ